MNPKKSKRRLQMDKMNVGETIALYPEPGEEHGIYQTCNERWVKLLAWKFNIVTGILVAGNEPSNCRKVILITRTE